MVKTMEIYVFHLCIMYTSTIVEVTSFGTD